MSKPPGKAIVVGHAGQDGILLCKSLKQQGISVLGFDRNSISLPPDPPLPFSEIGHPPPVTNPDAVCDLVGVFQPEEIYYLAAHHTSSEQIERENTEAHYREFHDVHVLGLLNFLCAIKERAPGCRLFYASSSLVFGGEHGPMQDETTQLTPIGFYGLTKAQGMMLCRDFRVRLGVFASSGILYNHESSLRPDHFLSKRIVKTAHQISLGMENTLTIGDLDAKVDWGYAPDYVQAFQKMIRLPNSDDFIVSSGEAHAVREFVDIVFECFDLDPANYLQQDNSLLVRRAPLKIGDSSKLRRLTGWQPSLDFKSMVRQLVKDTLSNFAIGRGKAC